MARNGSGVYSLPAGSIITNGDTSDATDINTPLSDIETDLNTARPIVAGGTGATTASGARTNLGLGAAAVKGVTGSDSDAVTGTAGTDGNLAQWNADGDIVDGPDVLDEDDMSSDSATALATQQSIKAYVDSTATDTGTTNGTSAASTSGTAIDFTSIPSTAKRIRIMFGGVSTSGSSVVGVQVGDSGGFETTGYLGSGGDVVGGSASAFTTMFGTQSGGNALHVRHGMVELNNVTGNQWVASGVIGLSNSGQVFVVGGSKTLSGTLDRVRITTVNGTDTFDAGNINISWEG